jgi:hypothetical protein
MVALWRLANGMKFTEMIFENVETAEKWIKDQNHNRAIYSIRPVAYYTADGEIK